jgi:hypothetical protein
MPLTWNPGDYFSIIMRPVLIQFVTNVLTMMTTLALSVRCLSHIYLDQNASAIPDLFVRMEEAKMRNVFPFPPAAVYYTANVRIATMVIVGGIMPALAAEVTTTCSLQMMLACKNAPRVGTRMTQKGSVLQHTPQEM